MDKLVTSRFAPSPTGPLHLGHALSAVLAHDRAREAGGRFLLRIEDTDTGRCRAEFVDGIFADLTWLGLRWDAVAVQSERLALYDAALERLKAMGVAYPCFCTRGEIAREVAASVSAPHGPDGPLYPGTCRGAEDASARLAAGEPHSWRLDAGQAAAMVGPLTFVEEGAGDVAVEPELLGDLVLKGRDRPASYHLAAVVDDAAQGVTHVVRGRDILPSTHPQRLIQALLEIAPPIYRHHALVGDADGRRLAKRHGAPTLAAWRKAGEDGRALADRLRTGELPAGFSWATP